MKAMDSEGIFVTASELLEYLFCPRFIYFMNCLCISQHEDRRYKVQIGREVHTQRETTNVDYLRKKIGCVGKESGVWLSSPRYNIKGVVDEVLTLDDGTMAPLDYKFAEYNDRIFSTYRYQVVFYALLIQENYGKEVNRGFVCYTRSNSLIKEITVTADDFNRLKVMIDEMIAITQKGYYPAGTKNSAKCLDCCYRNVCS